MTPLRFRPRLETVEERVTPASVPGVLTAFQQTAANSGILVQVQRDPGLALLYGNQPVALPVLAAIAAQGDADAVELRDFQSDLRREIAGADPQRAAFLTDFLGRAAAEEQRATANAFNARSVTTLIATLNAQLARQATGRAAPDTGAPGTGPIDAGPGTGPIIGDGFGGGGPGGNVPIGSGAGGGFGDGTLDPGTTPGALPGTIGTGGTTVPGGGVIGGGLPTGPTTGAGAGTGTGTGTGTAPGLGNAGGTTGSPPPIVGGGTGLGGAL